MMKMSRYGFQPPHRILLCGIQVIALALSALLGVAALLHADIAPVDPTTAKKKCPAACGGALCGDNDCYCDGDYCVIA
jgi:hypothetical protein